MLHRPGGNTVLRKVRFPDADVGSEDRRLHLDLEMLLKLVDLARASPLHRVVIHGVGVEVEKIATPRGHVFESWAFVGHPVPEGTSKDLTIQSDVGQIKNRSSGER